MTAGAFDARRFTELCAARGLRWGAPLVHREATGSTNDDALAAARGGAPSGSLFVADHQSAGRGRRGKSWSAAPGGSLLFSVVVRPEGAGAMNAVTLAVGLGVRAALQPYSREPLSVKWPNDVLAGSRKLAGVLCEGQLHGARLGVLVIGVGINVAQQPFPSGLEGSAASLASLAGLAASDAASGDPAAAPEASGQAPQLPERELLLTEVLAAVEARALPCLAGRMGDLLAEFSLHDALFGARVGVSGATPLAGVARGIDAEGRLLLETEGALMPVHAGTVRAL